MRKLTKIVKVLLLSMMTLTLSFTALNAPSVYATVYDTDGVYDEANLLSSSEIESLKALITQYEAKYNTNLIILTKSSLNYEDPYDYVRETCLSMNLDDSAVILVNMEYDNPSQRGIYYQSFKLDSYTDAIAYDILTEERCLDIYQATKHYFSEGNYYKGFEVSIEQFSNMMDYGLKNDGDTSTPSSSLEDKEYQNIFGDDAQYVDGYIEGIDDKLVGQSWFQLIISFAIGGVAVIIMAFNSGGKVTTNQRTYLNTQTSRVLGSYDHYVRTSTTRHKRESSSSSSGGGSTGSSSGGGGSSHGGGGGF